MAESKKEMALRAERAEVALRVMEAERAELAAHARLLAAVEDAKARETEATLDTPTFLRVNSADAKKLSAASTRNSSRCRCG